VNETVKPHRQRSEPYREPSPPPEEEGAVLTCEEMREYTGTANAVLLVLATCVIAWIFVGR
jgi:hypothetical protein